MTRSLTPAALTAALLLLAAVVAGAAVLGETPDRGSPSAYALLIGAGLGYVFQRSRFCFYCNIRDAFEGRGTGPVLGIVAALAVGGTGYAVLMSTWLPNPRLGLLPPEAHIGPVSPVLVAAGLAFGFGMVLSGSCISGHLYRLAEGSTRAPFALAGTVIGFVLGFQSWDLVYLDLISEAPVPWLPASLGYGGSLGLLLAVLAALALVLLPGVKRDSAAPAAAASPYRALAEAVLVRRWPPVAGGAIVGVLAVLSYFKVQPLGVTAEIGSLARTAAADLGWLNGRLIGLDTFAGCATQVIHAISDNGLLVGGLVLGAFAGALPAGQFQPRRQPWPSYGTALAGGVLLGFGAMLALGCTVGVLLSGIMAFALSGWVFALAMLAAIRIGLIFTRKF
ncbi:YeeE/YedE family protein [Zavarzinia compransoris]|uniref:Uncharacterized protein n=1 Tax=Zavarzinia compransoris TaxID=1264899 RepID=A0A317DTU2_9PROT|nr:YeeE/YedE family protein [Zavarzinia compransoris]PWR17792.1 hypothetical protein DKG75_21860 [Zavarzinia compransoris]TDP49322.1 hypothetical protein DES42_101694 [Zavarzinia compransoris]